MIPKRTSSCSTTRRLSTASTGRRAMVRNTPPKRSRAFTQSAGGLFSPDHPFFTEKVAMTMVGNWATNALRIYAPNVEYTVCAIPTPENGRTMSTPLGSNVFAIPVGSKNPELAAVFFNYCIRPEVNATNYDIWRSIPCIDSQFDEISWTIAATRFMLWSAKSPTPRNLSSGLCAVSSQLRADMLALRDDVIYNGVDPQPLLQALAEKLQPELD